MGERAKKITNLIHSSEMICSLMYEDAKGCPYNTFTPRSIAALSGVTAIVAVISLFAGM